MKSLTPILTTLIVACNLPLLAGAPSPLLVYQAESVAAGEYWRIITHPFVHVSWYHLVLDAGAFLLLWIYRPTPTSFGKDVCVFMACALGSLIGAQTSVIPNGGFCGLSGIAHGLMVYQGVCWACSQTNDLFTKRLGWIMVIAVVGKSVLEGFTGTVMFDSMHLGSVGSPIPACHLGGAVAGLLIGVIFFAATALSRRVQPAPRLSEAATN